MKDRDPSDVERLLLLSLHYRKSYTTHFSSDVEYAANVAAYLRERLPASPLVGWPGNRSPAAGRSRP